MPLALGVKFRRNGPLNYYDAAGEDFAAGDRVIADTARGPEIGEVVLPPAEIAASLLPAEVKPVAFTGAVVEAGTLKVVMPPRSIVMVDVR